MLLPASLCIALSVSAQMANRPGNLLPGEYRVAALDAWGDRGQSMLNAPAWERVVVRDAGETRELTIHYKGGKTASFSLQPSSPKNSHLSWRTSEFTATASAAPGGGTRLSMHFCYRGFVHLTLQAK